MPFAQDIKNIKNYFRPQPQSTSNKVLDNVFTMTNQLRPKQPQPFSEAIKKRSLMGANPNNISPQHAQARTREVLDNQYNQMLMSKLPQQDPYYLSPNRANLQQPKVPLQNTGQPINNPNLANPNMKAGSLNLKAMPFFDWINTRIPLKNTNEALQRGYANFSYEAIPSSHLDPKRYPLESEIYKKLRNDSDLSAKYEHEIYQTNLFKDTAHKLGLKFKDTGQKAGYYADNINGELQSVSNPSRQVQILPEYDKNGNLTQEFQRKMQILSGVMGKALKQDAVTWHIPNIKTTTPNGVSVNLGGIDINGNTLTKLDEALGKGKYGFIPDANGQSVRIIDFNGNQINPQEINSILKKNGYNTSNLMPFDTKQMDNVKDFGYMGNQDHFEPNWQYSQDYYDKLIKESANANSGNIFGNNNIYPSGFGYAKQLFTGKNAGRQWQDFIDTRRNTIREIGERLREKPLHPQTTISNSFDKKGFITPNLASHIATSGTGALVGASQDSENRLRGAFAGAIGGAVTNKFIKLGTKAFIKNQTDNIAKELPNLAKGNPKLFNQIAEKTMQGGYKSEQKGMKKGVIGGEKAILTQTSKANLATAKELEAKGANELEIWEKTGWYKDELDGKWKVEINPNGGELKNLDKIGIGNKSTTKLSDILDDPELFEAYPQLADIKMVKNNRISSGGVADIHNNTITLGKGGTSKSTIYHEIQHFIQNAEGFSNGYSDNTARILKRNFLDKQISEAISVGDLEKAKQLQELKKQSGMNIYLTTGGEVEARNVSYRLNPDDRVLSQTGQPMHPFETMDVGRDSRVNIDNFNVKNFNEKITDTSLTSQARQAERKEHYKAMVDKNIPKYNIERIKQLEAIVADSGTKIDSLGGND